jgi:ABC-type glutathione transport system ATPase component
MRPVHRQRMSRPPSRSWRTERIVNWFDLTVPDPAPPNPEPEIALPNPGQILMLCGASGSGKSTLLRRLTARLSAGNTRTIDLARLPLPDLPVVDCLPDLSLEAALLLLGRMGLGEAWTYLRTPTELSDGQRWRLRLCVAVHEAGRAGDGSAVLVCDEYAALLDRVTAAVVSRSIRKLIDVMPWLSAILATAHDDVIRPLQPDRVVHCDFGQVT